MTESKTLSEFYERLSDIFNEYFSLGEKLDDSVLVRKIVQVLHDRFNVKLTAMEEAKDFSTIKVEELMGSLCTFELNQMIRSKEKPSTFKEKVKTIAFKSTKKEASDDEDDDTDMALLAKNF
uniref:Uncharacterized protein n=1 Tax=Cannabis sativa TaxID=3483 RepID=A0A803NL55_CANSA